MIAYTLLAHLNNLLLTEEDGEMSWIGTEAQWALKDAEIKSFEDKYHGV